MAWPWNGWYHGIGGTYGSWLRGDERGWRARHHREHVDGDYRQPPPPGMYDGLRRQSAGSMKRPPIILAPEARRIVAEAMLKRLSELGTRVARLSVGGCHFHVLMRIENPHLAKAGLSEANALADGRNPLPRHVLGLAKKHASHVLRERALKPKGTLWAKRPKIVIVEDRRHYTWLRDSYLPNHAQQGAVVLPTD